MEKVLNYNYGYDPDLMYRNLCQVMNCGLNPNGAGWYRTIPGAESNTVFHAIFDRREIFLWIESELRSDLLGDPEDEDNIITGTIDSDN